ncbi:hypothetical protein ACQP1V_31490 [Microtetraspora malaysiensis]|uniref:hypothetical protein n=1 Tax=Microtetraspora malaysiensis TaxID=161358 RepID=UPI003D8B2FBE
MPVRHRSRRAGPARTGICATTVATPGRVLRPAAPHFATPMIDTSIRVSNTKTEPGWAPVALPTYRQGVRAPTEPS